MPIEINLPCKCPHCGEEFELFQSLAQDVLETVQTRLLAADTQVGKRAPNRSCRSTSGCPGKCGSSSNQIETLQQQLINEQATHAALQATLDQRMQNAMTQRSSSGKHNPTSKFSNATIKSQGCHMILPT